MKVSTILDHSDSSHIALPVFQCCYCCFTSVSALREYIKKTSRRLNTQPNRLLKNKFILHQKQYFGRFWLLLDYPQGKARRKMN